MLQLSPSGQNKTFFFFNLLVTCISTPIQQLCSSFCFPPLLCTRKAIPLMACNLPYNCLLGAVSANSLSLCWITPISILSCSSIFHLKRRKRAKKKPLLHPS